MGSIVIAPFSNSDIRDWPLEHFEDLLAMLVGDDRFPPITLVGTERQQARASLITHRFASTSVTNACGSFSWPELCARLRDASCVVGNNSGIAHLAASYGVPTVCIFGGSHQRTEWRPIGPRVVVLSETLSCSPCHLDHGARCPYDKLCLAKIRPEIVRDTIAAVMHTSRSIDRESTAYV